MSAVSEDRVAHRQREERLSCIEFEDGNMKGRQFVVGALSVLIGDQQRGQV